MSKGKDDFGDRMKQYEMVEAGRRFMPLLPTIARLDGRSFSKFTRGLLRPYDERMSNLMVATTKHLVENTGALIGYTQSDEISLVFYSPSTDSQVFFDGRIMKMTSVLASMASAFFTKILPFWIPEKSTKTVEFDCRVWQVPNLVEGANAILWREQDATKNSVSMAARGYYSHQDLLDKGRADMMDLLMANGINWNDYPTFFKRGTYIQKKKIIRAFTPTEIDNLPDKHEARKNPDLKIERTEIRTLNMPPFSRVLNRVEVIFDGANPVYMEHTKEVSPRLEAYYKRRGETA
jgi:tRNA(His) guanylyltransferase